MQSDTATRHQVYLEQFKALKEREIRAFLRQISAKMAQSIRLLEKDLTTLKKPQLVAKIKELQRTFQAEMLSYQTEFFLNLHDLRDYEFDFMEQNATNDGFLIDLPGEREANSAMFDTAMILGGIASGFLIDSLYKDFVNNELKRIANTMQLAYANGADNNAVINMLNGNGRVTGKNAQTITNTIIQHASYQVMDLIAANNPDVYRQVEWVSVLDARTSAVCRGLSGRRWLVGSNHPVPPQHHNCRSSLRYIYVNESTEAGAAQNYYEWLKTQNRSFIESVLGKTRTRLFLEGGLSVKRFQELQLNKRFEPRTLAELRELIPETFRGL